MNQLFNFHFVNDQLMNMGSVNSAAELQGLLCGRLCSGEKLDRKRWQTVALAHMDLAWLNLNAAQEGVLDLLLETTQQQLGDNLLRFYPLLPDDSASLERRTVELGGWCEGFLHGLGQTIGQSGLDKRNELSAEVSEALTDLARISQAAVDDGDEAVNEAYWIELVEYVKVAVLTLFTELNTKPKQPDTLH